MPLTVNERYMQFHSCKFNSTLQLFPAEPLLTAVFFFGADDASSTCRQVSALKIPSYTWAMLRMSSCYSLPRPTHSHAPVHGNTCDWSITAVQAPSKGRNFIVTTHWLCIQEVSGSVLAVRICCPRSGFYGLFSFLLVPWSKHRTRPSKFQPTSHLIRLHINCVVKITVDGANLFDERHSSYISRL